MSWKKHINTCREDGILQDLQTGEKDDVYACIVSGVECF